MHMKFSTHMENAWLTNTSFLSYPSKTYPYSLETVSMETEPNLCIFKTHEIKLFWIIIYLYIIRIVRCPWNIFHNESSI